MQKIITKNTRICDAKELLGTHGVPLSHGWEMVMGMMLHECDYITIDGYGCNAKLVKHMIGEEEENETVEEAHTEPESSPVEEREESEGIRRGIS